MSQTATLSAKPAGVPVIASIPYYDGSTESPSPLDGVSTLVNTNPQSVPINDIRPHMETYTLDTHGFEIVKHKSIVSRPTYTYSSWRDPTVRDEVYNPEILELAKTLTGAKKIIILVAAARRGLFKEPEVAPPYPVVKASTTRTIGFEDGIVEGPVRKPHKDWGPIGARNALRNWSDELVAEARDIVNAEDEAAALPGGVEKNYKGRRWALYTTWRPLKPVKRDPMGYVDYFSSEEKDGASFWRDPPGIHGTYKSDVFLTKANPKHKWYWLSDQKPDEVLLMKIFDSESEKEGSKIAGGVHHCSFHIPGTEEKEIRESIETKFIAFW